MVASNDDLAATSITPGHPAPPQLYPATVTTATTDRDSTTTTSNKLIGRAAAMAALEGNHHQPTTSSAQSNTSRQTPTPPSATYPVYPTSTPTSSSDRTASSDGANYSLPLWLMVARTRLELAFKALTPHKSRPQLERTRRAALCSLWDLISLLAAPASYPDTAKPEMGAVWETFFRKNASLVLLCHTANAGDPRTQEDSDAYLLEEYHALLDSVRRVQPHIWRDVESWIWHPWKAMWWRIEGCLHDGYEESFADGSTGRASSGGAPPPSTAGSLSNMDTADVEPAARAKSDDEYSQFLWMLTVHDTHHGLKLFKDLFARSQKPETPDCPPPFPDPLFQLPPITSLDLRRCRVRTLPADAHCQYRALADQLSLNGPAVNHHIVRTEVCEWLRRHADFRLGDNRTIRDLVSLSPSYDWNAFCDKLDDQKEPVWGDLLTLQAAAQLYRRQILVVSAMRGGEVRQVLPFSGLAAQLAGTLYLWHWDSWTFGSCTL